MKTVLELLDEAMRTVDIDIEYREIKDFIYDDKQCFKIISNI